MIVLLMRHAKADSRSWDQYPDDGLRPLTEAGRKEHERLCTLMARMGISPDHIVTSPLVRARQTAEIAARALGYGGTIDEADVLGDSFSIGGVVTLLKSYPSEATVVCVGHEPDMSTLGAAFLSVHVDVSIEFKKSAVLGIGFPGHAAPGTGSLLYFFRPKLLLRLS